MATPMQSTADDRARFAWLEDPGRDFSFYRGQPAALSAGQWLFLMAAVVVGFLVVALPLA